MYSTLTSAMIWFPVPPARLFCVPPYLPYVRSMLGSDQCNMLMSHFEPKHRISFWTLSVRPSARHLASLGLSRAFVRSIYLAQTGASKFPQPKLHHPQVTQCIFDVGHTKKALSLSESQTQLPKPLNSIDKCPKVPSIGNRLQPILIHFVFVFFQARMLPWMRLHRVGWVHVCP